MAVRTLIPIFQNKQINVEGNLIRPYYDKIFTYVENIWSDVTLIFDKVWEQNVYRIVIFCSRHVAVWYTVNGSPLRQLALRLGIDFP
jgi:hypothetical protein